MSSEQERDAAALAAAQHTVASALAGAHMNANISGKIKDGKIVITVTSDFPVVEMREAVTFAVRDATVAISGRRTITITLPLDT